MIDKTKKLMLKLGLEGEIIEHPDINGTHSKVIAKALDVPIECIIKCLILKSKRGQFVAAIILGNQRLDLKKLEKISGLKKFSLASKVAVKEITGYSIGGVPPIAVIDIMPAFVDKEVLKKDFTIGFTNTLKTPASNSVSINDFPSLKEISICSTILFSNIL